MTDFNRIEYGDQLVMSTMGGWESEGENLRLKSGIPVMGS